MPNDKFTNVGKLLSTVKGFNDEVASVTRVPRTDDVWRFTASCGTSRIFKPEHFYDPRAAAMLALESHRHG
jgi:hypothetical protein